jgi:GGDEF domain-containing protein
MAGNIKYREDTAFYRVILSPVTLLIPIVGICTLFSGGVNFDALPPFFSMGIVSLYVLMVVAYVIIGKKNRLKVLAAVSAIANGALLLFLSALLSNGTAFTVAGFFIMLSGMLIAITSLTPEEESLFARRVDNIISKNVDISELKKILNSIQYPCVFLEKNQKGEEEIIASNTSFADIMEVSGKDLIGVGIRDVLPEHLDDGKYKRGNDTWVVKRTAKGRQVLLMLSPVEAKAPTKIEIFDSIDPTTGLYVIGFMKHKARSDIESIIRGKRKMSAVLFRLSYPNTSLVEPSDEEKSVCSNAFSKIVMKSIRVCDSAYRVSNDEILLLMPDTPATGADKVVLRIYATTKKMSAVECTSLAKVRIEYAKRDFMGGTDLPHYDKILDEMTASINVTALSSEIAIGA